MKFGGGKTVSIEYNRNILKQAEKKLADAEKKLTTVEEKISNNSKFWAIEGAIVGVLIESCTAVVTLGSSLLAGGAGVAAGSVVGKWIGKKLAGDPEAIRRDIENIEPDVTKLQDSLAEADRAIELLKQMEKKAQTAHTFEMKSSSGETEKFTKREMRALAESEESDYSDVVVTGALI